MPAPSIQELLEYANLQMAAEARYPAGFVSGPLAAADLTVGNTRTSKFPDVLAQQFAPQYNVLAHKKNTSTGFSGTLFQERATGEIILSIRSTEFIDDAARDNEATNKSEIKALGFAFGQIADLKQWWSDLNGPTGPLAGGQTVTLTGYSLGAHVATAFHNHAARTGAVEPHKSHLSVQRRGCRRNPARGASGARSNTALNTHRRV